LVNGARPGVILESDNPIPVEAAEQLRQNWERIHRGADRAFRTCVLPNGVKAHELSGSNEAAQMLESRQFSVIEICRLFRVPPHLIQELTRSTYSNIEVQGTEFVQHCLLPHLKRWEAAIARDLIVDDERYFAEHSVSGLLRGDHTSRASYYVSALQNGWMTINEVRELENLNPIDGGDVHFVPMNMQTLEQMTEEPEPAPEPEPPQPPALPAEPEPEPPAEQLDPRRRRGAGLMSDNIERREWELEEDDLMDRGTPARPSGHRRLCGSIQPAPVLISADSAKRFCQVRSTRF